MAEKTIRIGGGSAFWGDSAMGPSQLVGSGDVQYLMLDYLAELTMSILVRARRKDPSLGYATDFIVDAMRATLRDVVARGVRVIANAGGVNPASCARALAALAEELGVKIRIGVVEGDDLLDRADELRRSGVREMGCGIAMPGTVTSINAYLGAFPIARALERGADIVITGRCVDSALALGPLIHEFGWTHRDHDLLAAGSLAGHLLECGTQVTGGIHTDWQSVPNWAGIGYPVADCRADGSFVLTKPKGTGGLVTRLTVAEQMLYEIGDPSRYVLPDVVVDFTGVKLTEIGPDEVLVEGARGRAPTGTVKVSATYDDGWRGVATRAVVGRDAVAKAERTAQEMLARMSNLLEQRELPPLRETCVEVLGSEKSSFGPSARGAASREVVLRLAVKHADRRAINLFAREVASFGTAGAPGTTGSGGGRSTPQPVLKLFSFLFPKSEVCASVRVDSDAPEQVPFTLVDASPAATGTAAPHSSDHHASSQATGLFLRDIAVGRSGDKGDISNIGLIARDPSQFALLWSEVTPEWVRRHLGHLVRGRIERYQLPGVAGMNLVLHEALGGGGMASLRNDPLGKTMAHILLEGPLGGAPAAPSLR